VAADVSMSLDNVLAVAGAAQDHPVVLVFSLVLSSALIRIVVKGCDQTLIAEGQPHSHSGWLLTCRIAPWLREGWLGQGKARQHGTEQRAAKRREGLTCHGKHSSDVWFCRMHHADPEGHAIEK
jgi:hypothetical protein